MRKDSDVVAATSGPGTTAAPSRARRSLIIRIALIIIGAALVLSFPLVSPNPYILSAGVIVLNYAVLATGWNFVGGFTGYISLGHAAYFGLGAYGTGLLIQYLAINGFLAMFVGTAIVMALAVPISYAALKVRGASFVITTLALVLILLLVFQGWRGFTGGSDGLTVAPPFQDLLRPEHHLVFFYLYCALLAVALLCWWLVDRSRFGTGLKAIREDEDKAQSLGVPTMSYKVSINVVSAGFTALGGGMYALWFGFLDPIFQFSILVSSYMVLMALLGGIRHLFGPVLGAIVVGVGLEYFKLEYGDTQIHLVATGLLLGIVVLFMPDGVIPAAQSIMSRFKPQESSIREMTAEELVEENRRQDDTSETVSAGARSKADR